MQESAKSEAVSPSEVIFESDIPGIKGLEADFVHLDTSHSFTRSFIPHENIPAIHVVTLSAGKLDATSKNNLRGIALRIRLIQGINSPTFHPLLNNDNDDEIHLWIY